MSTLEEILAKVNDDALKQDVSSFADTLKQSTEKQIADVRSQKDKELAETKETYEARIADMLKTGDSPSRRGTEPGDAEKELTARRQREEAERRHAAEVEEARKFGMSLAEAKHKGVPETLLEQATDSKSLDLITAMHEHYGPKQPETNGKKPSGPVGPGDTPGRDPKTMSAAEKTAGWMQKTGIPPIEARS